MRAVGDGSDDVLPGHDARVEVHFEVFAHRGDHARQQVERDRRPVELPAAVVG